MVNNKKKIVQIYEPISFLNVTVTKQGELTTDGEIRGPAGQKICSVHLFINKLASTSFNSHFISL